MSGDVAYVPGDGDNTGVGVEDVISSVQSTGAEASAGWKGVEGGPRLKIDATLLVGFCAMSSSAPIASVGAELLPTETRENN